ncbi:MAG: hypothetical protein CMO01_17325 [Thalassobius sp.]|nr:hypothetical protein [Thalassovita sp.]|tara:strand:+ start:29 stop:532 length:504 start_codon:yes stop_codon:yes gene_type:complete
MGMIGIVARISEVTLKSFLADSTKLADFIDSEIFFEDETTLDLEKNWEGIHYILSGTSLANLSSKPTAAAKAFFTLQVIDAEQDFGYGPVQYLNNTQVKETNLALQKISIADIDPNKLSQALTQNSIYPECWDEPENIEWLFESFDEFKSFYAEAAKNNEAVISFIS